MKERKKKHKYMKIFLKVQNWSLEFT